MKRRELIRKLEKAGFTLARRDGKHDVYARGTDRIPVPRHAEVNEHTARAILRKAGLL